MRPTRAGSEAGVVRRGAAPPGPAEVALRVKGEAKWVPGSAPPVGGREDLRVAGAGAAARQRLREAAGNSGGHDPRGHEPDHVAAARTSRLLRPTYTLSREARKSFAKQFLRGYVAVAGCSTRPRSLSGADFRSPCFSCKPAGFRSGAEGNRTPALRRAKALR